MINRKITNTFGEERKEAFIRYIKRNKIPITKNINAKPKTFQKFFTENRTLFFKAVLILRVSVSTTYILA